MYCLKIQNHRNTVFMHSNCRLKYVLMPNFPLEISKCSIRCSYLSPESDLGLSRLGTPVTCPDVLCLSVGFSVRHLTGRLCQGKYKAAYMLNDVEAIWERESILRLFAVESEYCVHYLENGMQSLVSTSLIESVLYRMRTILSALCP